MKEFTKHNVFFVGIGGIGMSALARWFNANGFNVVGYDKTTTPLTSSLQDEGITIHFKDALDLIPEDFKPKNTLIIYTPAIPAGHSQLNYFNENKYEVVKRAQVLGRISRSMFTIAVAGTHGKTTTSSIIAHLLHHSGVETTAFLGGIAANYNSNLLLSKAKDPIAVIEADEYDRSFLQLSPNIEIITAVDADHLDIYGDAKNMQDTYKMFNGRLMEDGNCYIAADAQQILNLDKVEVYGRNSAIRGENAHVKHGRYIFDYVNGEHRIDGIELNLPGDHNRDNTVAAISVAKLLGISDSDIRSALVTYKGVKRRFEYIIDNQDFTFIDDYAHHPAEITAFLTALKLLYPDRLIQIIFQPHLFTRTRDFAEEFAESLSLADKVILMDIYPARELPIPGVTAEIILAKIDAEEKCILNEEEILARLENELPDVLATVGAGNIDKLVPKIKEMITKTMAA